MSLKSRIENQRVEARLLTVLVADDSADERARIHGWLVAQGHTVLLAGSGDEGARIVRERAVDLVITEVIMPNGDGLELLQETRTRRPRAQVIAMSAGGRYLPAADCLRVARALGAQEALLKPLSSEMLLAAIERVFAHAGVTVLHVPTPVDREPLVRAAATERAG